MRFFCVLLFLPLFFSCQETPPPMPPKQPVNLDVTTFYVGTYTRKEGHVDGKATGIYTGTIDAKGQLRLRDSSVAVINPSYLAQHGDFLFAVNEHDGDGNFKTGTVTAFAKAEKGTLTMINQQSSEGAAPCHLSVSPDGKAVLVANYVGGNFAVLPIDSNGALRPPTQVIELQGNGPNPERQEAPHAHFIDFSPDGKSVFACDLGTDKIYEYGWVKESLQLKQVIHATPGGGPRHLTFSPSGKLLYVLNELQATIEVLDRTGKTLQTVRLYPEERNYPPSGAAIRLHPSGKFLYASQRGEESLITAFAVNKESEHLEVVGYTPVLGVPRDFAIEPSGRFLIAAAQDVGMLQVFSIDQQLGNLRFTGEQLAVPTPVCLLIP